MKSRFLFTVVCSFAFATLFSLVGLVQAQETETKQETAEQEEVEALELAGGDFKLQFPTAWNKVEAKSSMIEVEVKVPMADGDDSERDGRLTIMAAGGSIDANIERWKGQFSQPDGSATSEKTKVEEIEVDGMKAHMVDISGTYGERARMTAPPTMREDYRMLAAIIETGTQQYFIKFYGGSTTVEANEERFKNFIKSFAKSD